MIDDDNNLDLTWDDVEQHVLTVKRQIVKARFVPSNVMWISRDAIPVAFLLASSFGNSVDVGPLRSTKSKALLVDCAPDNAALLEQAVLAYKVFTLNLKNVRTACLFVRFAPLPSFYSGLLPPSLKLTFPWDRI